MEASCLSVASVAGPEGLAIPGARRSQPGRRALAAVVGAFLEIFIVIRAIRFVLSLRDSPAGCGLG
jgi:hypothetical protein